MPYQAQALDTIEPFSDSDWEVSANLATYNVVSGCALTYDSGNMTVDVAAGVITHNGVLVTVAAAVNAVTLVSDGSNPRWTWIHLTPSGVLGITSGTAAVTPAKPELGDNVAVAAVLIAASETIANDVTKIDKRIPAVASAIIQPAQITNTEQFVARGGAVLDLSGAWTTANAAIYVPVPVNRTITIKKLAHKNGATAGTDNVDVGLYDSDGEGLPQTRLTSIGPTAVSGANVWQEFNVTDVEIAPGLYYLAAVMSGTTDTSLRLAAVTISLSRDYSMYQQLSAGTLPSAATPVVFSATRNVPLLLMDRAA